MLNLNKLSKENIQLNNLKNLDYLQLPHLLQASGSICVPGSKSLSNRALLLASVCGNLTRINDVLIADDTNVMLQALTKLGINIEYLQNNATNNSLIIHSQKHKYNIPQATLHMGNAGTAMRPLSAMLACMALNNENTNHTLHGIARMHERPIKDLVDALQQLGCNIEYLENNGYPPIRILSQFKEGLKNDAKTEILNNNGIIHIKGNISSQFLSSLLMAIPIVTYEKKCAIDIHIEGDLVSKPYVYLTLDTMQKFGVHIEHNMHIKNDTNICLHIPENSCYKTPKVFNVEGDASSASYCIAAGLIAGNDNGVCIANLGSNSIQGDIAFVDAARLMGAHIDLQPTRIYAYKSTLHSANIDCKAIPDAAMALAILALFVENEQPTTLYNIASWKVKETDRILAMYTELTKLGAIVTYTNNEICIQAPKIWQQPLLGIDTYDDHRMAMCFSLCAFSAKLQGIRINQPACVAKTYPQFFEHLYQISHTY